MYVCLPSFVSIELYAVAAVETTQESLTKMWVDIESPGSHISVSSSSRSSYLQTKTRNVHTNTYTYLVGTCTHTYMYIHIYYYVCVKTS